MEKIWGIVTKKILFISILLLFLFVSSYAMASDNHRRGFIIGGLGGVGVDNGSAFDRYGVKIDSGTNIVLHGDFRIGRGFKGDKLMLYFWGVGNVVWPDGSSNFLTYSYITGVGVSYYFKPIAPSFYVNAGLGQHVWILDRGGLSFFYSTEDRYEGFGIMGGIGYEFVPHWSVECGVMWGNAGFEEDKLNSLAISLSIIGIAY